MELGEKLRMVRRELGLSQKALCGEKITRNMLSLIENGAAKPSMETLGYLAERLGKPVSYFLDETVVVSPNQQTMAKARGFWDAGEFGAVLEVLGSYREPDPVFDREEKLLTVLARLALAEQALREGKPGYGRELLEKTSTEGVYCAGALERQRLLLLGRLRGQKVSGALPSLDKELELRAAEALEAGDWLRAGRLLDAAEDQNGEDWLVLRGRVYLAEKDYERACRCLKAAGETAVTVPLLEICCRELGDFREAYRYACLRMQERRP